MPFRQLTLPIPPTLFETLQASILASQEAVTKGRRACITVQPKQSKDKELLVPILRTTTPYQTPPFVFPPALIALLGELKEALRNFHNIEFDANNVMCEVYTEQYRDMKAHTDLALDNAKDSFIGLFSLYDRRPPHLRELETTCKATGECKSLTLDHGAFVFWDLKTNQEYVHKIMLRKEFPDSGVSWMGLTFRLSKTFVKLNTVREEIVFAHNDRRLRVATDKERQEFYKLKSQENKLADFSWRYDQIDYTLSPSDLLAPIGTPS